MGAYIENRKNRMKKRGFNNYADRIMKDNKNYNKIVILFSLNIFFSCQKLIMRINILLMNP